MAITTDHLIAALFGLASLSYLTLLWEVRQLRKTSADNGLKITRTSIMTRLLCDEAGIQWPHD